MFELFILLTLAVIGWSMMVLYILWVETKEERGTNEEML